MQESDRNTSQVPEEGGQQEFDKERVASTLNSQK